MSGTGRKYVSVEDYAEEAAKILPRQALGYYKSGALAETTLRENKSALSRWYIVPRVLRDVSRRSLTTTLFGREVAVPFGVAPTAMHCMAHPDGEVASVKAAARHNMAFTVSTIATTSLEDVAAAAPDALRLFQLYIYRDRSCTEQLVRRAEKAGYAAVVLTVDAPIFGMRRADVRNNFTLPRHLRMANFDPVSLKGDLITKQTDGSGVNEYVKAMFDPSINWDDLRWLINLTTLPVVVKGVLSGVDAGLAVQAGVAGVWVSNHGGRQVDGVPPSIEALVAVVAEVRGRCPVFVDGGFTQGTDVFKALALGADMVFVGRPVLWGLACRGEDGVFDVLEIIRDELDNTMANAGCCTIKEITSDMVIRKEHYAKL